MIEGVSWLNVSCSDFLDGLTKEQGGTFPVVPGRAGNQNYCVFPGAGPGRGGGDSKASALPSVVGIKSVMPVSPLLTTRLFLQEVFQVEVQLTLIPPFLHSLC